MRPSLVPIQHRRHCSQRLPHHEEPAHAAGGISRSESRAKPGAKHRDHGKHRGTREKRRIRRNVPSCKISGKESGEQRIGTQHQDDREHIAANDGDNGLQHGINPPEKRPHVCIGMSRRSKGNREDLRTRVSASTGPQSRKGTDQPTRVPNTKDGVITRNLDGTYLPFIHTSAR
jgi:hypothetical protein